MLLVILSNDLVGSILESLSAYWLMCFARIVPIVILSNDLVGSSGLEPPTSRLSGVRSNQLSYEPILSFRFFSLELWLSPWWR